VAFDDRVEAASGLDEWTEFGSELSQGFVGQRLLCGAHRSPVDSDCRGEILRGGMCRTVEVGLMEENFASDDRRHIVLFDYTFALC